MKVIKAVAAAAGLLTATGAAHATTTHDPAADTEPGDTRLLLTISGTEQTWIRGVWLDCPDTGNGHHPRAADACTALERADGDPGRLPGRLRWCALEHAPVTATAQGTWRGQPVDWHRTYASPCTLQAHTGPVFAL